MSKGAQTRLNRTKNISHPTEYVNALLNECADWAFNEEEAPAFKGLWREKVFKAKEDSFLNLEIGPGNGRHFSHLCQKHPEQKFLTVELKYKPLIQTVRRLKKQGLTNGRGLRYNAVLLDHLFKNLELNNIYIHFPDPWPKKRQRKHRLLAESFAGKIYKLQRPGSFLEIKTDDQAYLLEAKHIFKKAGYVLRKYTQDLHQDSKRDSAFFQKLSQFELLFVKKNTPVGFLSLEKP
ncbi:MAG: tRNA (guanine-N7)-methyltransferase [Bdellovibrionales bacterium]|nr:tRNA (guanine-N7)-methyltransferase [Bdellovibrionales bacterium]